MDLAPEHYLQLTIGLAVIVIMFVAAYAGPEKTIIQFMLLLMPFQPIDTRYGSLNTGLALLVMGAFLLNRRVTRLPLFPLVLLALLIYLVATIEAPRQTYKDHIFYLVSIAANVSLFYIIFNYVMRSSNVKSMLNMFIWTNVLVVIYTMVQLKAGFGTVSIMGVDELTMVANREDRRLAGPFLAVGITAEYMVIQVFIILYRYFNEDSNKIKLLLLALLAANMGVLVGTGNRGGFLVLIAASLLFFFMFRRDFGTMRLIKLGSFGVLLFALVATTMLMLTDFNVLFERLSATEISEKGVPDSRSVIWPLAIERIQEAPFIGHGPRIRLTDELTRNIPGHEFMPYPHSLYLWVFYTTGILGFMVLSTAFLALLLTFLRSMRNRHVDLLIRGMPKLALVILFIITIDQIKVSMMRFNLSDYQQYVASLLGLLLGASYLARSPSDQQKHGSTSTVADFQRIIRKA